VGFFDLPAPLFGFINQLMGLLLPAVICLVLWGVLAGWLTMVVYRKLSNQDKIQELKAEQKQQQKIISNFDGEFEELFPVIRHTLALGMRQLGLSLGPALLATIPILFIVIWVAGEFGHHQPATNAPVKISFDTPVDTDGRLEWSSPGQVQRTETGWELNWPATQHPNTLLQDGNPLLKLPSDHAIPVIHKRQWWNWLMANPAGYLPDDAIVESFDIELPEQQFLAFGPGWIRGWMFSFFLTFLLSSIGFKLALKID
jgi:hypothetical protein